MDFQRELVFTRIRRILANQLRLKPEVLDFQVPFLEMGADSIVLTECIRVIDQVFGVRVSIRDIFERFKTIQDLAEHVNAVVSPKVVATLRAPKSKNSAPSVPVLEARIQQLTGSLAQGSKQVPKDGMVSGLALLQNIFRQQSQLMEQQLQLLKKYNPSSVHPRVDSVDGPRLPPKLARAPQEPVTLDSGREPDEANASGFWIRSDLKPGMKSKAQTEASTSSDRSLDFSLYYFGNYERGFGQDKYDLIFEGAKYADRHGFKSVWIPERHFHAFGGFSPNPSLMAAALARQTEHLRIRPGSIVLPIHHPIRVAEEWAVVDNLSGGRVDLAFASGWHPNDFVFAPQHFAENRNLMFHQIETVRKLWRGESLPFTDGAGKEVSLQIFPKPVQPNFAFWLTIVNNPETYAKAGEMGAGVLTNLMGQNVEDLAQNLRVYRQALADSGHDPHSGKVTVLVHTFVGEDTNQAQALAKQPFCDYLKSSLGLFKNLLRSQGVTLAIEDLAAEDIDYLLEKAYERYSQTSGLLGSPESCASIVRALAAIGVDEIACFVDFGVPSQTVLESLPHLKQLKDRFQFPVPEQGP